ncbi:hypothetical protein D3C72_2505530 [compost metagenome]
MAIEVPEVRVVDQVAEKTQGLVFPDGVRIRHVAFEDATRHGRSLADESAGYYAHPEMTAPGQIVSASLTGIAPV